MLTKFRGYIPYTEEEITKLWNESFIVFDANVLLNLYRYSKDTQEELLQIFERFEDRVWLPNQSAKEYLRNRKTVIAEQQNWYRKIKDKLCSKDTRLDVLSEKIRHLHINPKEIEDFIRPLEVERNKKISEYLETKKSLEDISISKDNALNRIITLFNENIGDEYDSETYLGKCEEAQKRYKYKIPPGYEDLHEKSEDPLEESNAFGDFILWSQVIDFAKSNSDVQSIILVTDDLKEDWFSESKGIKTGPRSELIQEFFVETQKKIWIYNSERFMKYASDYLSNGHERKNIEVALDEIRQTQESISSKFARTVIESFNHEDSVENIVLTSKEYHDFAERAMRKRRNLLIKEKEIKDDIEYSRSQLESLYHEYRDIRNLIDEVSDDNYCGFENLENCYNKKMSIEYEIDRLKVKLDELSTLRNSIAHERRKDSVNAKSIT